jgi:preprotein translocase subunit SecE
VSQQENAPNKPVHLMYFGGGLILFFVLQWTIDWIWGYFTRTPPEWIVSVSSGIIALTAGIVLFRSPKVHGIANEVSGELKKVTWPSAKEVRAATIIVIVMAIISAAILGLFDAVWSKLTQVVYG